MKKNTYNHGASNKGCSGSEGAKSKSGNMPKPKPDMSTPSFGKGHANQGGKKS